jgi:excisionase family DNA binding protein
MTLDSHKTYTLEEVSKILKITVVTAKRLIYKNEIKANKIGGQWRISSKEIDRLLGYNEG